MKSKPQRSEKPRHDLEVKLKPLYVIILDQTNRMATTSYSMVNGTLKCDHIKRLIAFNSDYIKRVSLY